MCTVHNAWLLLPLYINNINKYITCQLLPEMLVCFIFYHKIYNIAVCLFIMKIFYIFLAKKANFLLYVTQKHRAAKQTKT